MSASNLGEVGYFTGSAAGSNQIAIDAIDNLGASSADFLMTINVAAPTNQPPTITGQSTVNETTNQSFTFTSLIQGHDSDGTVASYEFFDSIPGAGYLTLNGVEISGTSVTVSAANLGEVGYFTGSAAGSNDKTHWPHRILEHRLGIGCFGKSSFVFPVITLQIPCCCSFIPCYFRKPNAPKAP